LAARPTISRRHCQSAGLDVRVRPPPPAAACQAPRRARTRRSGRLYSSCPWAWTAQVTAGAGRTTRA